MLRKNTTLWILIACAIPLLGWWTYGLFDLDEGFYAAVISEMNRKGEWITPYYNGVPWFEKPILLYWLGKPSLALFGEAIGPRLPDVITTMGAYAMVLWFCRKRLGEATAIYSTLIFASSILVVALGRMMMTDPLLMFCITAAFLTFWESLQGNSKWRILTGALLGLGVLAKGPVVGILFLPVILWVYARHPGLREKFKGNWPLGLVCFALVVASWYLPSYLSNGHIFIQEFIVKQNLERFSGGDQAHLVPNPLANILFYVVIILVCYIPWSFFLPVAWKRAEPSDLNGYLKAWFLTVFIFFTITGAKLPHYILPVSAPLAILVGQYFAKRSETKQKVWIWPATALVVITFLANFGFWHYYHGITIGPFEFPGYQAEVHEIARYVRANAGPNDAIAEFKIGRQQKSMGTGHIKIQETKEPSVLLYLNRDVLETDDWKEVLTQKGKVWIITRGNRITPVEEKSAGARLHRLPFQDPNDLFRLYVLDPLYVGGAKTP